MDYFIIYLDEIQKFTGGARLIDGPNGTAGLFTSFPKPHITHITSFADQVYLFRSLVFLSFGRFLVCRYSTFVDLCLLDH